MLFWFHAQSVWAIDQTICMINQQLVRLQQKEFPEQLKALNNPSAIDSKDKRIIHLHLSIRKTNQVLKYWAL